jgi:phosphoglycolate phosphatase
MANVIFDFDGTLADTLHVAVEVFRKLAPPERDTGDKEIERLRGLSATKVIKELGIPWWRLPRLLYEGRKEMTSHIEQVETFPGMRNVLQTLHDRGHKLFVLSSNSTKNISVFLKHTKLDKYFDGFWGDQGIFAKSAAIKKIVRKQQLDSKDCYYVGDEVRDIEAARKAGIRPISVTWGYNNRKALEAAKAQVLVDRPEDLLTISTAGKA